MVASGAGAGAPAVTRAAGWTAGDFGVGPLACVAGRTAARRGVRRGGMVEGGGVGRPTTRVRQCYRSLLGVGLGIVLGLRRSGLGGL